MKSEYRVALLTGGAALASIVHAVVYGIDGVPALALVAAAGGPLAIGALAAGRLDRRFDFRAMLGGGVIGPAVALVSHAAVAAFAYFFLLGFADEATVVLDALRVDPRLIEALQSPWTLVLLVDLAVVAPLTEEIGKGLGGRIARPVDRKSAFLAGIAAGVGFAVVENVLYVGMGFFFGGPWPEIALLRIFGLAVHPLASGLVLVGWWDRRHGEDPWALLKGFLAGAGVHALWNGSIVAIGVVEIAFEFGNSTGSLTTAGFGYLITLGAVLLGALWIATSAVARDGDPVSVIDFSDARIVAGWVLLMSALLVPATIMVIAFPGFYGG